MVEVKFYGVLTELAGQTAIDLKIPKGTTFSELKDILQNRYPGFEKYPLVFFQDMNHCTDDIIVAQEKEVDCMPPFSGG